MAVLRTRPLAFPWEGADPFLFCVHHVDAYPAGNDAMGPAQSLDGRRIGQDFDAKNEWRMYHGSTVPGFPQHPHRGFETITIVRRGLIDHSDSLGAAARFGRGDVQWVTAGDGIVHSEMFPLLDRNGPNPLELFQIWINLPKEDKLAPPHFTMLWSDSIPRKVFRDDAGKTTEVTVVAGALNGAVAPAPPPRSWASRAEADVAIFTIHMEPGARFVLPATKVGTTRTLYVFAGTSLTIDDHSIDGHRDVLLQPDSEATLHAGPAPVEILLLQGRPIGEPVVQYGPFVMNTRTEIQRAITDYQATQFGGWPWPKDDPVHPREEARFARHADGRIERP